MEYTHLQRKQYNWKISFVINFWGFQRTFDRVLTRHNHFLYYLILANLSEISLYYSAIQTSSASVLIRILQYLY